jgi:hypothetical protein
VRRVDLRRIVLVLGGAALAAVLAGGLVVVFALDRGGAEDAAPSAPQAPVAATASLSPRLVLFGDTVTASVDVVLDRTATDPDAVRVVWDPAPWRLVRPPERTVDVVGGTVHVRTRYLLRCLTRECAPARSTEQRTFPAARVSYPGAEGGDTARQRVTAPWPTLVIHSRLTSLDTGQGDLLSAPWRADLRSLPAVTYRVEPGLAIGVLVALATLLFGTGAVLTYRAWPRPEPPPEPEPPPPPVVSPLEQALALLESATSTNGSESRRRALELVADEVEELGEADLALAARSLAWSPDAPEIPATRALAGRVRSTLGVEP